MNKKQKVESFKDGTYFSTSQSTKKVDKGDYIYKFNEEAKESYILLEGVIETEGITNSNSDLASTRILEKGSTVGLLDIVLDRNYSRNMKAKSTCILAVVKNSEIKNTLCAENSMASSLLKSLAISVDNTYPGYWS